MADLPNSTAGSEGGGQQTFLSPELKEILAFTESENEKHRAFFEMLYKWTASALTIIVVVIGALIAFVGWHTISDIRKQAQAATEDEVKATRQQAQAVMSDELLRMRREISGRLDSEFQTPIIRSTVSDAARTQTQSAMMPLIRSEVHLQVSSGVSREQAAIKTVLTEEAHKSIAALKPTIEATVAKQVDAEVRTAVKSEVIAKIDPELKQLQASASLSTLITSAQSGDGPSFDTLSVMSANPVVDESTRASAGRVVRSLIQSHNGPYIGLSFKTKVPQEKRIDYLKSTNPLEREAAINQLSQEYVKDHIEEIFQMMISDQSLEVREASYIKCKAFTKADFLNLDMSGALQWWSEHSKEFINKGNP